jgi:hypothetical protein
MLLKSDARLTMWILWGPHIQSYIIVAYMCNKVPPCVRRFFGMNSCLWFRELFHFTVYWRLFVRFFIDKAVRDVLVFLVLLYYSLSSSLWATGVGNMALYTPYWLCDFVPWSYFCKCIASKYATVFLEKATSGAHHGINHALALKQMLILVSTWRKVDCGRDHVEVLGLIS